MKKIDMAKAIGLADEDFVAEAAPKATRTKSIFWRKFAIVAACITLVLTSVSLWLFLPYQNEEVLADGNYPSEALKDFADSDYLGLMEKIHEYEKSYINKPSNNFEKYVANLLNISQLCFTRKDGVNLYVNVDDALGDMELEWTSSSLLYGSIAESSDGNTMSDSSYDSSYVETTDNQVAGVIETDLFKRTKTHIFYFDVYNQTLRTYSIAGEESRLVSEYVIKDSNSEIFDRTWVHEMFLTEDGNTLTLIGYERTIRYLVHDGTLPYDRAVLLISLDVSDPENIKERSRFSITGYYNTARVVDGKILLFSKYSLISSISGGHTDISRFVPMIDTGDGMTPIPADSIILPDEVTSKRYTVVTRLNEADLAFEGAIACLSYSDTVYVSADKIFVTRSYTDYIKRTKNGEELVDQANLTEITAIRYGGGSFEKLGSISVDGGVKNQYSLDEFEGVLRVVTTTGGIRYIADKYYMTDSGIYYGNTDDKPAKIERIATNAALYCIDLSTFKIVGEVRDFAPEGETVESVRFDGTNAYVCTAVVWTFTDPVYFFDLSDMNNITYTDTGDIEGYSSSLVNFGEGLLLGIGYGENRSTLKIEVYAEGGDKVISLDAYEVAQCSFSSDYKSYFIDRERGLVGLMISDWNKGVRYILLGFDGYELFEVINEEFDSGDPAWARATLADNYFYMMSMSEFKAIKLFD